MLHSPVGASKVVNRPHTAIMGFCVVEGWPRAVSRAIEMTRKMAKETTDQSGGLQAHSHTNDGEMELSTVLEGGLWKLTR